MKNIGNYRKCDIFFGFRFTENMIFQSIAENAENMIFRLNVFSKMLFVIQCCFHKNFWHAMAVCGYLAKLPKDLFRKITKLFRISYSINGQSFNVTSNFFLEISNFCHKRLRFFLNQPLKRWVTEKKDGQRKLQKFE